MAGEAIFIGYRRDDTADVAGRIYDALEARFGRDRVFKDVDNIPVGANFGQYIKSILPRCRVALILMGPHWVGAKDAAGNHRLQDPNDWVRIEVETALATPSLQVVPVLVNGAQMPRAEDLPASLQPILQLNAAVIRRDPDFRDDIERLGTALRASVRTGLLDLGDIGGARKPQQTTRARKNRAPLLIGAAIAGTLAVVAIGLGVSRWLPTRGPETAPEQTARQPGLSTSTTTQSAATTPPTSAPVQEVTRTPPLASPSTSNTQAVGVVALGLSVADSEDGLVVVSAQAPSELQAGDIILTANRRSVRSYTDLVSAVESVQGADRLLLLVSRGGRQSYIVAELHD